MEEIVIKDGIKYKLVPEEDKVDPLLGDNLPSGSQPATIPQVKEPKNEETEDIELVDTTPKVKTPREYLMKTAQGLANARVNRVVAEAKQKRLYDARVGSLVSNKNLFPGEGVTETNKEDDE